MLTADKERELLVDLRSSTDAQVLLIVMTSCRGVPNSSVVFLSILSFLVFFHVILVLTVFACFGFSSLHHSK